MSKPWLGLGALLLAACGSYESPRDFPDEALGSTEAAFRANVLGIHYPGTNHADITESGLPFVFEEIREDLGVFNEETDSGETKLDSAYHADNCRLEETFRSVRTRYEEVVTGIRDGLYFGAMIQWGTILHTAQDFYSHSNWIDIGKDELVTEQSPLEFPSAGSGTRFGSVVVLEEPLPETILRVSRRADSRTPSVTLVGETLPGLITGTYDDNDDGPAVCPSQVALPHGPFFTEDLKYGEYLSKDDPDSFNHEVAKDAATRQTTEEFCRLARLVLLRHPQYYEELLSVLVEDRGLYEAMCPNAPGLVTSVRVASLF